MDSTFKDETQICKYCEVEKSFSEFRKSRRKLDNVLTYSLICKACVKLKADEKDAELATALLERGIISQVCNTCFTDKPLEGYYKRTSSSSGRDLRCKECTATYNHNLRHGERKEELLERGRERTKTCSEYNTENSHIIYSETALYEPKTCTKCLIEKTKRDFYRDTSEPTGFKYECGECVLKAWHERYDTDEEFRLKQCRRSRAYFRTENGKTIRHAWWTRNKRKIYDKYNAWSKAHKRWITNPPGERSARLRDATPKWTSPEDRRLIRSTYRERSRLQRETGVEHHVDHRIPINGKDVSGLHVWWNMEAVPAKINYRKSNLLFQDLGLAESQITLKPFGLIIGYDPLKGFNSLQS